MVVSYNNTCSNAQHWLLLLHALGFANGMERNPLTGQSSQSLTEYWIMEWCFDGILYLPLSQDVFLWPDDSVHYVLWVLVQILWLYDILPNTSQAHDEPSAK